MLSAVCYLLDFQQGTPEKVSFEGERETGSSFWESCWFHVAVPHWGFPKGSHIDLQGARIEASLHSVRIKKEWCHCIRIHLYDKAPIQVASNSQEEIKAFQRAFYKFVDTQIILSHASIETR